MYAFAGALGNRPCRLDVGWLQQSPDIFPILWKPLAPVGDRLAGRMPGRGNLSGQEVGPIMEFRSSPNELVSHRGCILNWWRGTVCWGARLCWASGCMAHAHAQESCP